MPYQLPSLPYDYGALEPYIDAMTMEIHHTKHHQTYVNGLNAALENHPELQGKTADELVAMLPMLPESIRTAVRNHGGGHANHSFFWRVMKRDGGGTPNGKVADEINKSFGSFDAFQAQFNDAAKSVFGSGWAWLVIDMSGKLVVEKTINQDSPLPNGKQPLIGLDVWEHAYYLKYQNRRPDYINAFWHVVDWEFAEERYRLLT